MKQKYEHLLFDLDNTLWDFTANANAAITEAYYKYGLGNDFDSPKDFLDIYHKINDQLWTKYRNGEIDQSTLRLERFYRSLNSRGSYSKEQAHEIGESYLQILPFHNLLIPHALEVLDVFKLKYKLHLITNGFQDVQMVKIEKSGLVNYFETIVTSEEAGALKPNAQFFDFTLQKIGAKPSQCIVIGDDVVADIQGAYNYGIEQVYFNPTNKRVVIHPTYTILALKELLSIL